MRHLAAIILLIVLYPCLLWAGDGTILYWDNTSAGSAIFKVNPDGSGLKEIIHNGRYPLWSPDKKMIAFVGSTGDIAISDAQGKEIQRLESTPGSPGILQHEPNYAKIVYFVWSPDGNKIGSIIKMYSNLYVLVHDLIAKKLLVVTNMGPRQDDQSLSAMIQFSSRGDKLLFSIQGRGDKGGTGFIDLSTKNVQLVSRECFARYWKNRLLFVVPEGTKSIFYVANEDGSQKDKIFESQSVLTPASDVKNDRIFLRSVPGGGTIQLLLFDLKTKKIVSTPFDHFAYFRPQFSPDGKAVLAVGLPTRGEQDAGYFILDIASGKKTLVREMTKKRDRTYWWGLYLGNQKDYSWR